MGVALLLAAVSGANVANLSASMATRRRPEDSVRLFLGASPLQVLQRAAVEAVLVSLGGALSGFSFARILSPVLQSMLDVPPEPVLSISGSA